MKLETAKAIVKRINKKEGEEVARLYENYSGRGMFGNTTTGVVAPGWAIHQIDLNKYQIDNLGMQTIIY